ncbi:hypothetical protein AJ79_08579 [Helicocarpus griseus UAMH5409]|uniref:Uncharacterized protein n=1 Tax=Helicocarpus griseus UAMH5409 TaxID=1447875 RepID=A0A2B7WIS4_9EURO|nr:hypothetical protein AJ79_08579 [Helicocarpus griseus UAMH5409]
MCDDGPPPYDPPFYDQYSPPADSGYTSQSHVPAQVTGPARAPLSAPAAQPVRPCISSGNQEQLLLGIERVDSYMANSNATGKIPPEHITLIAFGPSLTALTEPDNSDAPAGPSYILGAVSYKEVLQEGAADAKSSPTNLDLEDGWINTCDFFWVVRDYEDYPFESAVKQNIVLYSGRKLSVYAAPLFFSLGFQMRQRTPVDVFLPACAYYLNRLLIFYKQETVPLSILIKEFRRYGLVPPDHIYITLARWYRKTYGKEGINMHK